MAVGERGTPASRSDADTGADHPSLKRCLQKLAISCQIAYKGGEINRRSEPMALTICTLDHTSHSAEAVPPPSSAAAGTATSFTSSASSSLSPQAAGPAFGERVRRFGLVETNLVHASRAARAAGLTPTLERRFGHLLSRVRRRRRRDRARTEIILAEPRGLFQSGADIVTVSPPADRAPPARARRLAPKPKRPEPTRRRASRGSRGSPARSRRRSACRARCSGWPRSRAASSSAGGSPTAPRTRRRS